MIQYNQDNDELMARGVVWDTSYPGNSWSTNIFPYVKSLQVFVCPDDPTKPVAGTQVCSYAANRNLFVNKGSVNLSQFAAPAKTVMLFEVTNMSQGGCCNSGVLVATDTSGGGSSAGPGTFPNTGRDQIGWNSQYATGYQGGFGPADMTDNNSKYATSFPAYHTDGSVYAFMDGHAKWLRGVAVSPGWDNPSSGGAQNGGAQQAAGTDVGTFVATYSKN